MADQNKVGNMAVDFQFLSCRNVGSGLGAICASLLEPFDKLNSNQSFQCSLVLHRGVHFCKESQELYHLYYEWNDSIVPYDSVTQFMKAHTSVRAFVMAAFSSTLTISKDKDTNLRFLNQVSGYNFPQWERKLSLATRDGLTFHQASLKPDVWMKRALYPSQENIF